MTPASDMAGAAPLPTSGAGEAAVATGGQNLVVQADRLAAADYVRRTFEHEQGADRLATRIIDGFADSIIVVQAFAQHRAAATSDLRDALQLVLDTYGFDASTDSSIWQTVVAALARANGAAS